MLIMKVCDNHVACIELREDTCRVYHHEGVAQDLRGFVTRSLTSKVAAKRLATQALRHTVCKSERHECADGLLLNSILILTFEYHLCSSH